MKHVKIVFNSFWVAYFSDCTDQQFPLRYCYTLPYSRLYFTTASCNMNILLLILRGAKSWIISLSASILITVSTDTGLSSSTQHYNHNHVPYQKAWLLQFNISPVPDEVCAHFLITTLGQAINVFISLLSICNKTRQLLQSFQACHSL